METILIIGVVVLAIGLFWVFVKPPKAMPPPPAPPPANRGRRGGGELKE